MADIKLGDWVLLKSGIVGKVTGIGGQPSQQRTRPDDEPNLDWWPSYRRDLFGINNEQQENDWGPSPTPVTREMSTIVEVRRG